MFDPKISIQTAAATMLWFLGFSMVASDLFGVPSEVAHLGLAFCCGGAVLMIRSFFCSQAKAIREAFELGRDAGRLEAVPTRHSAPPPQRIH